MKVFDHLITPLKRLPSMKPNGSVLLFCAAILAIILANTSFREVYNTILAHPIVLQISDHNLFSHNGHDMTLLEFVNDALMAVFFFLVGLEIKQEILVGELSSVKKAMLPIIAACGGMIVPVLCFMLICPSQPESLGAAIPMATDIAFALAVLGTLGSKVPYSLKIFLTALAVVDDIGGIIVIAIFYSGHVAWIPLLVGFILVALISLGGRMGIHKSSFFYIMGIIVWALFLEAGIHPTIAGVLVAFSVPAKPKIHMNKLRDELRLLFNALPKTEHRETQNALVFSHHQLTLMNSIKKKSSRAISPVQTIEASLTPFVNYFVLPLFAFVNAGVTLGGIDSQSLLGIPLAIFFGLFVGKALGIFLFTYLAVRMRLCFFPQGMNKRNLLGVSFFGGIGFTVSLFIANLSYDSNGMADLLNQAKLGIFVGTIVSGVVGYLFLKKILTEQANERATRQEAA
ncbi:Na+/H+ antiporter NhaA [Porphyromonas pogonae]|uniref:Na+/H+ antiporter NhaA n=1 Tax=Porphyromonas pogonae TaxID=867595 RepID=UPI0038B66630